MVDKDGRVWDQSFMSDLGWKASELSDAGWEKWHKDLNAKDVPAIDMANLNPADILKDIDAAKALIPEGYEFKSVDMFEMNTYDDPKVSIKLNVVEKARKPFQMPARHQPYSTNSASRRTRTGKWNLYRNKDIKPSLPRLDTI